MARRDLKASLVLTISLLLFSLMLQCKEATRFGSSFRPGLCNCEAATVAASETRRLLDMEGDYNSKDETPPQNDYDYYRRQGDVPSPGIGH